MCDTLNLAFSSRRLELPENLSQHARFYRPELDVLRCLAFFLVYLHHAVLFSKGWLATATTAGALGVCLFFFLSAFLITELLEREQESTGTIHFRAFYLRRMLRIWPLYFALLLLDFGYHRIANPGAFTVARLMALSLLAGNWFVAHHGFTWTLSTPLWSISIEEQFYVLWPAVRRLAGHSGAILFSSVVLGVAYVALFALCRQTANLDTSIWVNSFVQFQFFATGSLLALLLRTRTPALRSYQRGLLFLAGLCAFFYAQSIFHVKSGPVLAEFPSAAVGYLLANLGCVALFLSLLGASSAGRARPLIYLGKISYGLYAFHWAVLAITGRLVPVLLRHQPGLTAFAPLLKGVVALAVTIAIASVFYRFFEAPILRFKRRFEVIRTRPA